MSSASICSPSKWMYERQLSNCFFFYIYNSFFSPPFSLAIMIFFKRVIFSSTVSPSQKEHFYGCFKIRGVSILPWTPYIYICTAAIINACYFYVLFFVVIVVFIEGYQSDLNVWFEMLWSSDFAEPARIIMEEGNWFLLRLTASAPEMKLGYCTLEAGLTIKIVFQHPDQSQMLKLTS